MSATQTYLSLELALRRAAPHALLVPRTTRKNERKSILTRRILARSSHADEVNSASTISWWQATTTLLSSRLHQRSQSAADSSADSLAEASWHHVADNSVLDDGGQEHGERGCHGEPDASQYPENCGAHREIDAPSHDLTSGKHGIHFRAV